MSALRVPTVCVGCRKAAEHPHLLPRLIDLGPARVNGEGRVPSGEIVRGMSGEPGHDWATKEHRRWLNAQRPTTRAGRLAATKRRREA